MEVRGLSNIPATGGALIICNHVSYVDVVVLGVLCPRPIRYLSWEGFERNPIINKLTRIMRTIPVTEAKAKDAIQKVSSEKQTLEDQLTDAKLAADDLEYRLELLFKSVTPFLDNLCKNSEKSTIYWPDRVSKIEAYKTKLYSIVEGK